MTRLRSPNYPSVSLQEAIDMTGKIYAAERTFAVDREVAARNLGYAGITGHSAKVLASLLQYGLLEKVAKNEVRVSDSAETILHPDSPNEQADALYRAAFAPSLFRELRERFPDGVPSVGNLRSYLVKQKFSDRAINPAINAYLQTVSLVQQSGASESHGEAPGADEESQQFQPIAERGPMHPTDVGASMPQSRPRARFEDAVLNDINVEIIGDKVRINALLDARGLAKLKRRIEAMDALIAEDEDEPILPSASHRAQHEDGESGTDSE